MTGKRPNVITKDVYERIKWIRDVYGDTQAEFAQRLGVPQSQVSYMEAGKREPNYETLDRLIDLGWDLEWVIKGTSDKNNKQQNINVRSIENMVSKLKPDEVLFIRKVLELYLKKNREEETEQKDENE